MVFEISPLEVEGLPRDKHHFLRNDSDNVLLRHKPSNSRVDISRVVCSIVLKTLWYHYVVYIYNKTNVSWHVTRPSRQLICILTAMLCIFGTSILHIGRENRIICY